MKIELKEFLIEELEDIKENPQDYHLEKMVDDFSDYIMIDYYDWIRDNYKSFGEDGFEKYAKK